MADTHQVSHNHNQHERDTPGRHLEPEQLPVRDEIRDGSSIVPAAVSSLMAAPPDGAPNRHASAINRLPSVALRRQLANGLVRRHGNAYLQRVLTTASASGENASQHLGQSDQTNDQASADADLQSPVVPSTLGTQSQSEPQSAIPAANDEAE